MAPRECGRVSDKHERAILSAVIARLDRATQYSREAGEPKSRGVLDRPVKPDDDNSLWKSEATKARPGGGYDGRFCGALRKTKSWKLIAHRCATLSY